MSYVNINMEDVEDGQIAMNVVYKDGFNVASHAHQHANLLMKYMERIATRQAEPDVLTEPYFPPAENGDSDRLAAPEEGAHAPADPT